MLQAGNNFLRVSPHLDFICYFARMENRWIYKSVPSEEKVSALASSLSVSKSLATLLAQRNITTFNEARTFFRPDLTQLHDPFLMKDMEQAVVRLETALGNNEQIMIYGDYDVDGTTSVALMYGFLQRIHSNLLFYIPDRYLEGYGISRQGIDFAHAQGVTLMICLDCGIKSIELVSYATSLGIDFIICDHHRPGDELPPAVAVLDPKRADCPYPYKELSGCGVGFKFLQAFCQRNNMPLDNLYSFMDLLVVSIASDIVPVTGENRVMAHFGLRQLNYAPRPGLKALTKIAGFEKDLDITNVVFGLGPRINAAGRIAHAHAAVSLLLSHSEEEAESYAKEININNRDRQGFDTLITREALEMIESDELLRLAKTTVLFKNTWHKGVIGIVASRCIEKYHRPTVILTESHDKVAGSARSVPGFDVYDAIAECADLLEQFGGHMYAAGLTLKLENVAAFQRKFEEVVARRITDDQLIPQIEIDLALNLSDVNFKFYNVINQMAPFGPQNMRPVFVSEYMYADYVKVLKEQHLKMSVCQENSHYIDAIGFGMAHFYEKIMKGQPFRLCYQVMENNYKSNRSLQLLIKDIKFYE
jgi:single-stranded-DNA-specific exonuclease